MDWFGDNYTTTRENRELRLSGRRSPLSVHYTTTRENREPRLRQLVRNFEVDYTTTRESRELRHMEADIPFIHNYTTTRENRELRPWLLMKDIYGKLYHYERKQGTTTDNEGDK